MLKGIVTKSALALTGLDMVLNKFAEENLRLNMRNLSGPYGAYAAVVVSDQVGATFFGGLALIDIGFDLLNLPGTEGPLTYEVFAPSSLILTAVVRNQYNASDT